MFLCRKYRLSTGQSITEEDIERYREVFKVSHHAQFLFSAT
jgi:hypothetical protein